MTDFTVSLRLDRGDAQALQALLRKERKDGSKFEPERIGCVEAKLDAAIANATPKFTDGQFDAVEARIKGMMDRYTAGTVEAVAPGHKAMVRGILGEICDGLLHDLRKMRGEGT